MGRRDKLVRRAEVERKPGKRDDFDASDEVQRRIDNQSVLRETDRDREIRHDRIFGIVFARVGIESGRKIDRENESVFFPAQSIDFARAGANRFTQERFRPSAEQTVEHDRLRRELNWIEWSLG